MDDGQRKLSSYKLPGALGSVDGSVTKTVKHENKKILRTAEEIILTIFVSG